MRYVLMCAVAVLWVDLVTPDAYGQGVSDIDYWRIRTRAKLSIARELKDAGDVVKVKTVGRPGRPWMIVYTLPGCQPCIPVQQDEAAGAYPFDLIWWDITQRTPPIDVPTVPAFHWNDARGKGRHWPPDNLPDNQRGYPGAKVLIDLWNGTQRKQANAQGRKSIQWWIRETRYGVMAAYQTQKPGRIVWQALGRRSPRILIAT